MNDGLSSVSLVELKVVSFWPRIDQIQDSQTDHRLQLHHFSWVSYLFCNKILIIKQLSKDSYLFIVKQEL